MAILSKYQKRRKKSTDRMEEAGEERGTVKEDQDQEETMSGEFCFIFCLILHCKKFAKAFSFNFTRRGQQQ